MPLATQRVKDTQPTIRENFQVIQQAFSVDHEGIQVTTDEGKHNKVTLPAQAAAPAFPAALSGAVTGLYAKIPAAPYPLTGRNEIFVHPSSGADTPMTACGVNSGGFKQGYTYLPSGVILRWGIFPANIINGSNAAVLPLIDAGGKPIPEFTTFLSAQITVSASSTIAVNVYFSSYNTGTHVMSLDAKGAAGSVTAYYFMIGV